MLRIAAFIAFAIGWTSTVLAHAVDEELLNVLLGNGVITREQHAALTEQLTHEHEPPPSTTAVNPNAITIEDLDETIKLADADRVEAATSTRTSRSTRGYGFETADGNWRTELQWRGQVRYTSPFSGNPRQISSFNSNDQSTFEARRLRMKIGGHGFQPWLKYFFELDLQPSPTRENSSSNSNAPVLEWRIDVAKWDWGGIRMGQWKIDYNRERVDPSARQQFVERSIVNRVFTVDRQIGVQLRGHAFKNTKADMRWYLGAFTGEGRGERGADDNPMYVGRLQWNLLGRDVPLQQTDVEYTELPSASLGFGVSTTKGVCTRWSSSGCGNLDGFTRPAEAMVGQFKIDQAAQDFAFKWRGWSIQQELHHKEITDRLAGRKSRLTGGYLQSGYFFHNMFEAFPKPLEFALRYAYVEEPNATDLTFANERRELSFAANWFFAGHNNKLTFDISRLLLEDKFIDQKESENRARLQWDVSF